MKTSNGIDTMNVLSENIKWANAYVEKLGGEALDSPSISGMLYVGFVFASFATLAPAKTTYDLFKRSFTQLSPKDFLGAIASAALTLTILALSPVVFIGLSSYFIYDNVDCQKEKPAHHDLKSDNVIYI